MGNNGLSKGKNEELDYFLGSIEAYERGRMDEQEKFERIIEETEQTTKTKEEFVQLMKIKLDELRAEIEKIKQGSRDEQI